MKLNPLNKSNAHIEDERISESFDPNSSEVIKDKDSHSSIPDKLEKDKEELTIADFIKETPLKDTPIKEVLKYEKISKKNNLEESKSDEQPNVEAEKIVAHESIAPKN